MVKRWFLLLVLSALLIPVFSGCGQECKRGHSETHMSITHDSKGHVHMSSTPVYVCDEYYPST